jgi:hypothetical protein
MGPTGEVMAAHRLGIAREAARQIAGLADHYASPDASPSRPSLRFPARPPCAVAVGDAVCMSEAGRQPRRGVVARRPIETDARGVRRRVEGGLQRAARIGALSSAWSHARRGLSTADHHLITAPI